MMPSNRIPRSAVSSEDGRADRGGQRRAESPPEAVELQAGDAGPAADHVGSERSQGEARRPEHR
jgi:hypothetical protein